jgi:hypothetical protein
MRLRLDDEMGQDDPLLSLVNLIDVFLVLIAALLLSMAMNPLSRLANGKVTLIRNQGRPDMEIVIRDGKKFERFKSDGAMGEGRGVRAGIAYRLADGSLVYVPE